MLAVPLPRPSTWQTVITFEGDREAKTTRDDPLHQSHGQGKPIYRIFAAVIGLSMLAAPLPAAAAGGSEGAWRQSVGAPSPTVPIAVRFGRWGTNWRRRRS